MIYEYALEPRLLNNWKDFRYFTEKFSFYEGRLISRFPKRWKRDVYALLSECEVRECSVMQLKRVEGLLFGKDSDGKIAFDDKMLVRQHEWNAEKDWLTNAEAEHGKRPFHAVLAKDNPREKEFVLVGDDVEDSEDSSPLFAVPQTFTWPKSAQEMAELVAPVLQWAEEILLIDPNFGPENRRHQLPMERFLAAAIRGRDVSSLNRVEIHIRAKSVPEFFRDEAEKKLPHLIPKGMKVRLVRWLERIPGKPLHNRFILTDKGVVQFGYGLDQGKQGQDDQIGRLKLAKKDYLDLWERYTSDIAFDKVDEVEIVGTSPQRR